MGSIQERKHVYLVMGLFCALALVTPYLDLFLQQLLSEILVFGLLAMSLDILLGFTGLASLGHAAYFGVASYAAAIVMTKKSWVITYSIYNGASEAGLGIFFLFFVGVLVAFIFSVFFGYLAIRAKDVYFLMITLSLAMVVWGLAYRWSAVTEGDNGIIISERPTLLGIELSDGLPFFYFALVVFLLCLGVLYLIVQSPFGKTLVGIREREERMEMLGYNVWLHKYLAFIIAGTFSGVAGVMWTLHNMFVSPSDVELITSAEALFMVALGGPATLIGPLIGAAIIRSLQQLVSIYVERWPLILGSIYIFTIMLSRLYGVDGILGFAKKFRRSSAVSENSDKLN
jgi:branched-chain amino acid transport system permease protein